MRRSSPPSDARTNQRTAQPYTYQSSDLVQIDAVEQSGGIELSRRRPSASFSRLVWTAAAAICPVCAVCCDTTQQSDQGGGRGLEAGEHGRNIGLCN